MNSEFLSDFQRFQLTYWSESEWKKIECLIESDVVELLLCANRNEIPAFIKFIVDDGEQMIIPSDNVHSLKQVYDHYEKSKFQNDV